MIFSHSRFIPLSHPFIPIEIKKYAFMNCVLLTLFTIFYLYLFENTNNTYTEYIAKQLGDIPICFEIYFQTIHSTFFS